MPQEKKSTLFIITFVTLIIAGTGLLYYLKKGEVTTTSPDGKDLKTFAQCITDSGAKFYGAFWCSHCQNQKKAFKDAGKYLPYIECSEPDGKTQTQICKDKNIEGYPTWIFTDGSIASGELSFDTLKQKTNCPF